MHKIMTVFLSIIPHFLVLGSKYVLISETALYWIEYILK